MVGAAATPMLSGVVKAVLSGDTLVIMKQSSPVNGPPPEMKITLSSIRAPQLSRDMRSDESFSWEARETLRRRIIGRVVAFRIDYRVSSLSRVYATVYPTKDASTTSVNIEMVEAGLARVRRPANSNEDVSPELDELISVEERAMNAGSGLHSGSTSKNLRNIPAPEVSVLEGDDFVIACGNRSFPAVVEYVITGSVLKAFALNVPTTSVDKAGDRVLTLSLTGVQCPGFRRPEGSESNVPPKAMPYAANARFLTEIRLLHRDVRISVEGVDRNGVLLAVVEDPTAKMYIGEELLRAGMAKTVSWNLDRSARAAALRAAERYARDRQFGVWKGFQAPAPNRERFTGKVIEVVSGDMLVILDDSSGKTRRITLASVRASRTERPSRERATMPLGPAADAKEALRKKLIGRRVSVKVEYIREPGPEAVRKEVMVFATVSREGDSNSADVALQLISNGLLSVVRHRGEEDRAANYEEYLEREGAAAEAKRGLHGPNAENTGVRINNLTGPDAKKRSRDVLAGLQRNGPYKGIVEYVTTGSRYRVYLPSESMLITLALRAVRSPQSTRRSYGPDGSVREEVPGEPHGDDAADFAREHMMQRDVEVEVQNVDRVGAFLGNLYSLSSSGERTDVSEMLLSAGHGYIHESFDTSRDRAGSRYLAVEKGAREAKRGVWFDYVEPEATESISTDKPSSVKRRFAAAVCEIAFGGHIFVQDRDSSTAALAGVDRALADLKLDQAGAAPIASLRAGNVVAAKFSVDERWYRARILFLHKSSGDADVRFIDYGNEERVAAKNIRRLGSSAGLSAPAVAVEVMLAHVVVPDEDDACGVPAGEMLRDLVYDKDIEVAVMSSDGPNKISGDVFISNASTSVAEDKAISVREEMLKAGLARIVRKKDRISKEAFKELRPFEEIGIQSRQFLWHHGEAVDSDCDEEN